MGEDYCYEVKLDGFRCLAFVDGEEVFLQSRNGTPARALLPRARAAGGRYVLDGEIVVRDADGREDFDALGQRIHPAASRIERLAGETPAVFVAFDLLARGRGVAARAALRRAPRGARGAARERGVRGGAGRVDGDGRHGRAGRALAAARRGRDRQGARRALPPGRAQGHGEGQARAHDRRGRRGLAPRQGAGHGRRADPRPLRRRASCAWWGTARG